MGLMASWTRARQHVYAPSTPGEKPSPKDLVRSESALREICAQLVPRASERQVRRALAVLRGRGLAVSTGRGPAARWKRAHETAGDE